MTTTSEVATWMREQLKDAAGLYQERVVHEIRTRFGEDHVYVNHNGNLAISKRYKKSAA